jgi:hypothetical protein
MRMAKAPQEHVDRLRTWMQFNDELCKIDPTNTDEWESLKNDWEEDEDFIPIIKHCEGKDGFNWEYYMDYYLSNISWIHMRIIYGFEVLVENACDSELDYLDYNKEIKELMSSNNDYWKKRCELAEDYISKTPCDPDIYDDQLNSYKNWMEIKNNELN